MPSMISALSIRTTLFPIMLFACSAYDGAELPGTTEQPLVFYDSTCTTSRKSRIQRAERIGIVGAEAAARSIGNNGLYKRWFGTYSSGRAADVQAVFDDQIDNWDFDQGDCDAPPLCTSATPPNAWISGTGPIHLCSSAFTQPDGLRLLGGGLAGTLIHERVHAVSVVTDETNAVCTIGPGNACNNPVECLNLAAASATEAVNNAENYDLFANEAHAARVINPAEAILFL